MSDTQDIMNKLVLEGSKRANPKKIKNVVANNINMLAIRSRVLIIV